MTRMTHPMFLLLAFGGFAGIALAGNWERFRGPNGTGEVNDKDVPLSFGAKENLVWKAPVPGIGNGSPIVWGNRIFLQSASKDGRQRTLLCLDTADGKIVWQKSIPGSFVKIRHDSSLASASPATDGVAVYLPFWDGKDILMTAFDMKGEKLWGRNLGEFNSQHGAGASPIVYKDLLIFANDMDREDYNTKKPNDRPSILMALNKKTGKTVWETPRDAERTCYSPPFLRKSAKGAIELVVTSTTAVTAYNPDTGAKTWEAKGWQADSVRMPLRTIASSALAGDVLIACSGDGAGDRLAVAVSLPAVGKTDTPERLWENRKDFPYVPCPLARGEHFYFINDKGLAGCYHARTGKRVWYERLEDTAFYASPLLIDGKIYATSDHGEVFVFAAEPSFKLLARNDIGQKVIATPAVADGRLYIRGETHLFCIGKK